MAGSIVRRATRSRAGIALRALAAVAAAGFATVVYVYVTLPDVRPLLHTNPKTTAWMEMREREAATEERRLRHVHRWAPYIRISQHVKRAVLVAEDAQFWEHEGVDFEQVKESIEVNLAKGAAVRGASTITQQLAKNLYLSPSRNPFRKVRELIIARRLEAELPKARIFELYLNLIEWGDGIWGVEAAARTYFGVSASALSAEQAALLAAAIVNPRALRPDDPTPRLKRRQRIILANMRLMAPPAPAPVVRRSEPSAAAPSEELAGEEPPTLDDPAPTTNPIIELPTLAPAVSRP